MAISILGASSYVDDASPSPQRLAGLGSEHSAPWSAALQRSRFHVPGQSRRRQPPSDGRADDEVGQRRTALAYEPRRGALPVARISVEFDERGRWAVVVDGIVLRYLPDAASAIEDARRLEAAPRLAAFERDSVKTAAYP